MILLFQDELDIHDDEGIIFIHTIIDGSVVGVGVMYFSDTREDTIWFVCELNV